MVPVINADTLTLANFLRPDLPPWSTASVNFTDSKTGLFSLAHTLYTTFCLL